MSAACDYDWTVPAETADSGSNATELVTDIQGARGLDAQSGSVFFAADECAGCGVAIHRIAQTGGAVQILDDQLADVTALRSTQGGGLYYSDGQAVYRSLELGPVVSVDPASAAKAFAFASLHVVWADGARILLRPLDLSAPASLVAAEALGTHPALDFFGRLVFFDATSVVSINLDGSDRTVHSPVEAPRGLTKLDGWMYWTEAKQGSVKRAKLSEPGVQEFATAQTLPSSIDADENTDAAGLCWWNENGQVWCAELPELAPKLVATLPSGRALIAVDGTQPFVLHLDQGILYRIEH